MSNTFTPNGLKVVSRVDQAAPTFGMNVYQIASNNSHTFFSGDLVVSLSTGFIDQWTTGSTVQAAGVFIGCKYFSTAFQRRIWSPNFPGSDTTSTVEAYVIDDPRAVFQVWVGTGSSSAAGGPVVQGDIQNNIDFQKGTGNTLSGQSGGYIDYATKGATSTLPLRIVGMVTNPPGMNGTDNTSAGNLALVTFNFQNYSSNTGI